MEGYKFYINGEELDVTDFECKELDVDLKDRLIDFPVNRNDVHVSELEFCNETAQHIRNWIDSGKKMRLPRKLKKKLVKIFGCWEPFLNIRVVGLHTLTNYKIHNLFENAYN